MGANTTNALFYLVSTLFEVYMWVVMLRAAHARGRELGEALAK